MWKDYSKSYLKNNRSSCVSVMAASFIATMFLSLLCCTAYNFWVYELEKIVREEGDWQGRMVGRMDEDDLSLIQNFENVESIVMNGDEADIYFQDIRTIYEDMPLIAEQLGLGDEAVFYHSLLLSRYLVHDPKDDEPPLLLTLYLGILILVSISLILIIRNSFELSMNARLHQFGILSGIGATPRQIKICLLQEAVYLSALPMLLGSLAGVGVSFCIIGAVNLFAKDLPGRYEAVFQYHPAILAITLVASAVTVLFSAWIPAVKLSRITPLEAIGNSGGLQLKKEKHSPFLFWLFGMEGELAGNALKAQRKALRISSLSLLLSFLGFSIMLCFTTLSEISTRETYFARYQDAWDIMATVKDTAIEDFELTKELRKIESIGEVTVYQKAQGTTIIPMDSQSNELLALGGLRAVDKAAEYGELGEIKVKAPIVVLDNESFLKYCSQIGITPSLEGGIVLNKVWDSVNSDYRHRSYVPFVKEDTKESILFGLGNTENGAELSVLAYTQEAPALREEYEDYGLVHFIPVSVWENISHQLGSVEADCMIRILAKQKESLKELKVLEEAVMAVLKPSYMAESENRIQEKLANARMIRGMKVIFGGFTVLLAVIGIANVFSNTLGFLGQRKREFARYMSIGVTPQEMKKIFCIEGFVIAGRPFLVTLPLTAVFIQFAVRASHLEPGVFWAEAPIMPILLFGLTMMGFVALAYYIGGKRILKCDLNEALRNDVMI